MLTRKMLWTAALCGVLAAVGVGQAYGQQRPGRGERPDAAGQRPQRGDPAPAADRMAQMRERAAERMKEQLGVGDEEWQVLQPMIEKVQTLRQEAVGVGRGMAAAGRGRRGAAEEADAAPASEVARAAQTLRETLQDENATPAQISGALTALRAAREKARQQLTQAQEELRQLLTQRQEAQLVLNGLFD